jgi:hypothetical protein
MPKVNAKRARVSAASLNQEDAHPSTAPEVLATITTPTVTTTVEGEEPVTDTTISVSSSPSIPIYDSIEHIPSSTTDSSSSASPLNLGAVIPSTSSSPLKRRSNKRERSASVELIENPTVASSSSMAIDEKVGEQEEEVVELEEGRKIAYNRRTLAAEALARERAGPMQTFKQAVWGAAVFGVGMGVT